MHHLALELINGEARDLELCVATHELILRTSAGEHPAVEHVSNSCSSHQHKDHDTALDNCGMIKVTPSVFHNGE